MPLPQLVMTDLSPLRTLSTSAGPRVVSNTFRISEGARKVVYSEPCFELCFCKNTLNGSENEFGIWPDDNPGRGSGSVPVNLTVLSTYLMMSLTLSNIPASRPCVKDKRWVYILGQIALRIGYDLIVTCSPNHGVRRRKNPTRDEEYFWLLPRLKLGEDNTLLEVELP